MKPLHKRVNREELQKKLNELKYQKSVAEYYGVSQGSIQLLCKRYGILTDYARNKKEIKKFCEESNLDELLKKYSANYIAKNICPVKTHASQIIFWANKLGIDTHTVKDSCKLKHVKESKRRALLEKYGVDNASKAEEVKEKKKQKAIDKYGVENVFMAEEIKEKSKQTMLEKYGSEHISGTNLFGLVKLKTHVSKFQKMVEYILDHNNIKFKSEVANLAKNYNKILEREYNPRVDIYVEEYNTVIECYGNLWHGNPKLYKPNDEIRLFKGYTKVKDIWEFDKERENQIKSFGFDLIIVWEYDINHNKQKTEKYILDELRKNKENKENKS